jgi:hypothetical protein
MKSFPRLVILIAAVGSAELLSAATYTGTVISVSDDIAKVAMDGDLFPAVGTRAEIFFKMGGSGEEISVATGSALKIDHGDLQVKIEDATGTVEKGQLVRFGPASSSMPATSSPTPTNSPPPASTSVIIGMWMGLEPGGDKISFTFREDGTVSYVRLKGKKKNILRGRYRTDCASTPCRLELFAFEVNGVRAKGETIIGLFELHESDMKFDLSTDLQRHPENGFTKGAVTLIRAKTDTPSSNDPR